jgi:hypothetical protein
LFAVSVFSQDNSFLEGDSIEVADGFLTFADTLQLPETVEELIEEEKAFSPDPSKAILYSAIFPGLGQIYNRKYWKLPFVYGGFLGCYYAISWNGTQYSGYRTAYRDFSDKDPNTNSWKAYAIRFGLGDDQTQWDAGQANWFSGTLRNQTDRFRRYRDLSIIIAVGVYAICMIDAYVDAHLFDFDISQDLSMRMEPVIFEKTANNARAVGLQWSFTF